MKMVKLSNVAKGVIRTHQREMFGVGKRISRIMYSEASKLRRKYPELSNKDSENIVDAIISDVQKGGRGILNR